MKVVPNQVIGERGLGSTGVVRSVEGKRGAVGCMRPG
jgi:hypothetical protein